MNRLNLIFFIFTLVFHISCGEISDKRLCIDAECNSPISHARTLIRYFSPDPNQLSFKPNEHVVIYSKSAGSNANFWGVEINGKRGYIPKTFVQETKRLGTPTKFVDTEIRKYPTNSQVPLKNEDVNPTKVKQNYVVTAGTTIYDPPKEEVYSKGEKDEQDIVTEAVIEPLGNALEDKHKDDVSTSGENIVDSNETEIISLKTPSVNSVEGMGDKEGKIEEFNVTESSFNEEQVGSSGPNTLKQYISGNFENDRGIVLDTDKNSSNENGDKEENQSTESKSKENDYFSEEPMEDISSDIYIKESSNEVKKAVSGIPQVANVLVSSENLTDKDLKLNSTDDLPSSFEDNKLREKSEPDRESTESNIDLHIPTEFSSNTSQIGVEISKSSSSFEKKNVDINGKNFEPFAMDSSIKLNKDKNSELNHISAKFNDVPQVSDEKNIDSDVNVSFNETTESKIELEISNDVKSKLDTIPFNTSDDEPSLTTPVPSNPELINTLPLNTVSPLSEMVSIENFENNEMPSSNVNSAEEKNSDLIKEKTNYSTVENGLTEIPEPSNSESSESDKTGMQENSDIEEEPHRLKNVYNDYISVYQMPKKIETDKFPEIITPPETANIHLDNDIDISKDSVESVDLNTENSSPFITFTSEKELATINSQEEKRGDLSQSSNVPSKIFSLPEHEGHKEENVSDDVEVEEEKLELKTDEDNYIDPKLLEDAYCTKDNCPDQTDNNPVNYAKYFSLAMDQPSFGSDFFLYLLTTAISVIIFLLGHFALDKSRRERPLVEKINKLEKEFLILLKEKEILSEQVENNTQQSEYVAKEYFSNLQKEKQVLEEQIQTLEKELENSTELGLELNRMLSDILSKENAGEALMVNIEGLQAQLVEQQSIVSNMREILSLKETENHELHLELDIANKRSAELQNELDKLLLNIIKMEEEKELLEKNSEAEMSKLKGTIDSLNSKFEQIQKENANKIDDLRNQLSTSDRNLQLKIREYNGLKDSIHQMKNTKNTNNLNTLVDINSVKAELEQMKTECKSHCDLLNREKETNSTLQKKAQASEEEVQKTKEKFDEVDKARLELGTKLQVLTNYFKEKEEELQKELSKYESMWSEKQGEATTTSERIKYLQSEVQNYKSQNESLKQEIVSQEVELKSQISVLEKKVHENWVSARQAERKLEDLKQEASQLRNRLTLRERAIQEDSARKRMQSPLEQSGELPVSPIHLENPASPPLLYNSREHITKSPPILGMPPPFLPPPHGAPFLPPPHLPFMPPPPPDMYPGDHRPPPLGRMSSPPLNSRYSPDRRSYSPYEGRSPSPSYDESEYGTSPARHRRYSPFSGRREQRWTAKVNGRSGTISSGSGNSNESLDELNYSNSNV